MTTNKYVMIDPPSGWKYGFPKRMPISTEDTSAWLIENGYPEDMILMAETHCRMWIANNQEDEDESR